MALRRKEGLRVRPLLPEAASVREKEERKKERNKAACKRWREAIKLDPQLYEEQRQRDKERNRANRQRPKTEEEMARQRELTRQRVAKLRAKKKAEKQAEVLVVTSTVEPRSTRAKDRKDAEVVRLQRAKWAEYKRKERERWTSQRWRRHRERNLKAYHNRKMGQKENIPPPSHPEAKIDVQSTHSPAPYPTKSALQKARLRVLKTLQGVGSRVRALKNFRFVAKNNSTPETPESKKIKLHLEEKLGSLKMKRDKKSLAKRRLLLQTKGEKQVTPASSPYKRKKTHKGTEAAKSFLEDQACHLPGKKTVKRKGMQQKKILPKRMRHIHQDFKKTHPETSVSLRGMYRHRQKHILTSRHQKLRQCLCEVCVNVDLKLDVINRHLQQPIDGRDQLSEMSVCASPTLPCLERKCDQCGIDNVRPRLSEVTTSLTTTVRWQAWEMVKTGKKQRKEKVGHEGTLQELVNQLMSELEPLSRHIFTHRWQHKEMKVLLSKLKTLRTTAVVVNDFSENYLCKYQDETQSAHWGYNQVTVHPSVMYYPCACGELITEYLVFLTDDLTHDAHLTRRISQEVTAHAESRGLKKVIMWSDGCAAQYKSKLPFYFAAKSSLEWVFFGSRHGKSACDACGGVVKALTDDDVKNGKMVQNARQMFDHLSEHHCLPEDQLSESECCHTKRSFRLIENVERHISSSSLSTIPGTRKIHHIKGQGGNKLLTRDFACFCSTCLGLDDSGCPSSDLVRDWQETTIPFSKSGPPTDPSPVPCSPSPAPSPVPPAPKPSSNRQPSLTPAHEPVSREDFFQHLQQQMCSAASYSDLREIVAQNMNKIQQYQVAAAPSLSVTDVPSAKVDARSLALRPDDVPCTLYPLCIYGDGNCFLRTLSVLVFGHQDCFVEMRVRLVMELVTNSTLYLTPAYLAQGSTKDGEMLLRLLLQDVDIFDRNELSPLEIFQQEVLAICKPGTDVNMWAVYAAANILKAPVTSVYPDRGEREKQLLAKQRILPSDESAHPGCFIMWTSVRNDMVSAWWKADHFVPLLPLHPSEEPSLVEDTTQDDLNTAFVDASTSQLADNTDSCPVPDEFYILVWQDGKEYVCQVAEVDLQHHDILVHFMQQQGSVFFWDHKQDSSWETLEYFLSNSRKVTVTLNEELSSQRRLLFNVV